MVRLRERFGTRVRNFRRAKGLTQEELAEKSGLHPTYIGIIERAEQSPTLDTVEKLAKALEIRVEDFFPPEHLPDEKERLILRIEEVLKGCSIQDLKKFQGICEILAEEPGWDLRIAGRKRKHRRKS